MSDNSDYVSSLFYMVFCSDRENLEMGKYIWRTPCKNCPSAHYEPDPEAIEMERWYKNGEIDLKIAIFPCAWRPTKYCKGVCDKMGVVEKQISERQDLKDRLNPISKVWVCGYSILYKKDLC